MATHTFPMTQTNTPSYLKWNRTLAGATSITKVTITPSSGTPHLTYTFDPVTGAFSASATGAPSTGTRTGSQTYPLVKASPSTYDNIHCDYGAGGSQWARGSCPPTITKQLSETVYEYTLAVEYETNNAPTLTLETTDNRTLYENDTFNLTGSYNDVNLGNVISVKYSVNNGPARALTSAISDGSPKTFNRVLTYKNNKLYDSLTVLTENLTEGTQNVVKVWAEDDQGGKSAEQLRVFYVVANRAPVLTVNPLAANSGLLNTGSVKFTGTVSDPDGNAVKVEYKIRNGSFVEVYNGNGGTFEITVPLSSLNVGTNAITIRAADSYGATTTRNLNVTKAGSSVPLNVSDKRYRVTPPNGSAQGLILWVQRESGDLVVSAEISMTAAGEAENFVPMTLNSTAFVNGSVEEDEFAFEGTEAKNNIVVRLKMTRTNPASTAGIILVNGVLS